MVEMSVRDEDPRARRAKPGQLETEVRRVAAGIDDRALGRVAIAADHVAVGVERTKPVSVDREWHGGESSAAPVGRSPGAKSALLRRPLRGLLVGTPLPAQVRETIDCVLGRDEDHGVDAGQE